MVAAGRIHPGQGLLIAEQKRLVRGVDLGLAQLVMMLRVEPDGAHETEGLGDLVGQLLVAVGLRAVLDEAEHPAVGVLQIGVAAAGEGAQQVQRRRRLAVGHELAARVGLARVRVEGDVVDDVAAIGGQLHPVDGFGRRRARLGELAGDAADLDHRHGRAKGHHHRHLEEDAEEIADIVGGMFGEAFGAVAALQQKRLAGAHLRQQLLQLARLAGEDQRRKGGNLLLDIGKRRLVRISRDLDDRLGPPAVGRPTFHNAQNSNCGLRRMTDMGKAGLYTSAPPAPNHPSANLAPERGAFAAGGRLWLAPRHGFGFWSEAAGVAGEGLSALRRCISARVKS